MSHAIMRVTGFSTTAETAILDRDVLRLFLKVAQLLTLMGLKFTHQSRRHEGLDLLSVSYIHASASGTKRTFITFKHSLSI
jgi:hypothetical protein